MNKKPVRYCNIIMKSTVTPLQKGQLLEESKTNSCKNIRKYIEILEKNEKMDLIEAIIISKEPAKP